MMNKRRKLKLIRKRTDKRSVASLESVLNVPKEQHALGIVFVNVVIRNYDIRKRNYLAFTNVARCSLMCRDILKKLHWPLMYPRWQSGLKITWSWIFRKRRISTRV